MKLLSTFFREPFTLLHLAWIHCTHCVHLMEFTLIPFRQTLHGYFTLPTTCVVPIPKDSHITLVFSSFILRPLSLRHSFHFLNFYFSSSSHFPTSTRSSAYSISHGRPSLTLCVTDSITMMKSSGLSTEPWCTPTFTQNHSLLNHHIILSWFWHVYTWSYTALTNHSSTPNFLMAHSTTFLGTLSKAFSRSTNAHHSSLCFPIYLSCNCLAINIAWVVLVPGLNPKLHLVYLYCLPQPSL